MFLGVNMKFKSVYIIAALCLVGCGSGPGGITVDYYGGSITKQSGTRLEHYLPKGSKVFNLGVDGQTSTKALAAGSVSFDSLADIIVIGWGPNEALQCVDLDEYRKNLLLLVSTFGARRVVLESPPLLTSTRCNASGTIQGYMQVQRDISLAEGVSLTPVVSRSDFANDDGIHPSEAHYDVRASELGATISKLIF
jgi:lysophospholipase L1-like esterase